MRLRFIAVPLGNLKTVNVPDGMEQPVTETQKNAGTSFLPHIAVRIEQVIFPHVTRRFCHILLLEQNKFYTVITASVDCITGDRVIFSIYSHP